VQKKPEDIVELKEKNPHELGGYSLLSGNLTRSFMFAFLFRFLIELLSDIFEASVPVQEWNMVMNQAWLNCLLVWLPDISGGA
jgi:hypothetical protein